MACNNPKCKCTNCTNNNCLCKGTKKCKCKPTSGSCCCKENS